MSSTTLNKKKNSKEYTDALYGRSLFSMLISLITSRVTLESFPSNSIYLKLDYSCKSNQRKSLISISKQIE